MRALNPSSIADSIQMSDFILFWGSGEWRDEKVEEARRPQVCSPLKLSKYCLLTSFERKQLPTELTSLYKIVLLPYNIFLARPFCSIDTP